MQIRYKLKKQEERTRK